MVRPSPLGVSVQCLSFYAFMFVVVLWLVFGVPRSSHVLLALVVLTEREWVGLFRECSIFEREEWYPEFGLAYDKLCWSQEWLSLVLAVSFLSWRHARHFPCSFLLGCACSAVVRACGRFARHVALWASTVSTFSTPCAFLSVYRLQFCELLFFFAVTRLSSLFFFFPVLSVFDTSLKCGGDMEGSAVPYLGCKPRRQHVPHTHIFLVCTWLKMFECLVYCFS